MSFEIGVNLVSLNNPSKPSNLKAHLSDFLYQHKPNKFKYVNLYPPIFAPIICPNSYIKVNTSTDIAMHINTYGHASAVVSSSALIATTITVCPTRYIKANIIKYTIIVPNSFFSIIVTPFELITTL